MKINGRQLIPANVADIWESLHDPHALQLILPGCEQLELITSGQYRIKLNQRIGPSTETITGYLKFKTISPYADIDFQAEGESAIGMVDTRGLISLEAQPEGGTAVCYEAEVAFGGQLASLSPRMLETTVRSFARRCQEGLAQQVDLRQQGVQTATRLYVASGASDVQAHRLRRGALLFALPLVIWLLARLAGRRRMEPIAGEVAATGEQPAPSPSVVA